MDYDSKRIVFIVLTFIKETLTYELRGKVSSQILVITVINETRVNFSFFVVVIPMYSNRTNNSFQVVVIESSQAEKKSLYQVVLFQSLCLYRKQEFLLRPYSNSLTLAFHSRSTDQINFCDGPYTASLP